MRTEKGLAQRLAQDRERQRKKRRADPEAYSAYQRERRKKLSPEKRERYRETKRKWIARNRARWNALARARMKRWREEHGREYRATIRDQYNAYMREWYAKNRLRVRKEKNTQNAHKYRTDLAYMLRCRLVTRVHGGYRQALPKGVAKLTRELLGCSYKELINHIAARFQSGMSWENRSLWHIDHIRPLASFNLKDPEDQAAAFHYTNLQPLWGPDNIRKGRRSEHG